MGKWSPSFDHLVFGRRTSESPGEGVRRRRAPRAAPEGRQRRAWARLLEARSHTSYTSTTSYASRDHGIVPPAFLFRF